MPQPTMEELFIVMSEVSSKMDQKFEKIEERFDLIDQKFLSIDEKFKDIAVQFKKIDVRFDKIEIRLDIIEENMVTKDYLDKKLAILVDDLTGSIKKSENKTVRLVNILGSKKILTDKEVHQVLIL